MSVYTKAQVSWIKAHGGKIGVVSETEARQRESEYKAKTETREKALATFVDPSDVLMQQKIEASRKAAEAHVDPSDVMAQRPTVTQLNVYNLVTQRGVKTFEAIDEAQARRMADRYGLEVSSIKEAGKWDLTPDRRRELLRQAGYKHGREKLELLIKAGQLPADSVVVQTDGDWAAIRKRDVEAIKKLEQYKVKGGYGLVGAIEAGISDSTLAHAGFSPETIKKTRALIAAHKGLQKVALEARAEALEHQQRELEGLKKYRHDVATGYDKTISYYDIDQALRDGVKPGTLLALGFPKATIAESQKRIGLPPMQVWGQFSSTAVKSLEREYPKFATYLEGAGLGFSIPHLQELEVSRKTVGEKEAGEEVRKAIAEAKAKGIKTPTERELFTAWGKALPEYKKWVISLPNKHPEKVALSHRLWNIAAWAGTMAMPASWAGIGTALRAITPALPVVSTVGRIATGLAQVAFASAPTYHTAANIAATMQMGNLEKEWEAFQAEPPGRQTYYAEKAGVLKPGQRFEGLSDIDKAKVLIGYTVPVGYTMQQWLGFVGEKMEALHVETEEQAEKLAEKVPMSGPMVFAGGLGVGLLEKGVYAAQLPLIAAMLAEKVPEGTAKAFAGSVAAGMVAFFRTELPSAFKRNPALASGRIIGLFFLTPKAMVTYAKGLGVQLHPRFVSLKALARDFNTIRIQQVKNPKLRLTKAEMLHVINELSSQVLKGKASASVTMKGGRWKATMPNIPYARQVPGSIFHFTPDSTRFKGDIRVSASKLFGSPQAALRFGMMSALRGQRMRHPGIVEIHLTAQQIRRFRAFKVLSKGEGELEVPIPEGVRLSPVPGPGNKGVSFDLRTGTLPILRYTLASSPGWRGPTLGQLAKVRVEAAKAALGDLVLGWYGRKMALKQMLAKDPRIAKVDKSISQLKAQQPELIGPNGEILRQRTPVLRPDGTPMKSRVKMVVVHPEGKAVLIVWDKVGKAWDLVGGSVDVKEVLTKSGKWRTKGPVTWQDAVLSQLKGELDLWAKDVKYLGLYKGKVHLHSLSGVRIFEGVASGTKLDRIGAWNKYQRYRFKYGEPELRDAMWWDGKTPLKGDVYPGVYDVLKARAKTYNLNMSNAKLFRGHAELLKARDKGFARRIASSETGGWDAVYKKVKGDKHVVFDLDGTLIDAKGNLYPGSKAFLLKLKAEGKTISLWTHSPRARAQTILTRHGLWDLFKEKITREGYEPTGKDVAAYKGIKKIKGDVLVDNSPAQQHLGKQLGKRQRVVSPEHKFSEIDIKMMNEIEIANLKRLRANIIKGEPMTLKDFLWSEPDITKLVELLQGRRRAITVEELKGRATGQLEATLKDAGLWKKYVEATKKLKGEVLRKRINELRDQATETLLDRDNGQLRKVLEKSREAAYRENYRYYANRYTNYYYKGLIAPPERSISVVRTEMRRATPATRRTAYQTELRRTTPEIAEYKPYVTPSVYKEPDYARVPYTAPTYKVTPYKVPTKTVTPTTVPGVVPGVVPSRIPVTVPGKPPPRVSPVKKRKDFDIEALSEKDKQGIVAWKQGWCYKCIIPSWSPDDVISSRKPLAGVKYYDGPGSAAASIIAKRGKIPPVLLYDMGIVDVRVDVPQEEYYWKRRPRIRFTADPKQKTRLRTKVPKRLRKKASPGVVSVR